MSATLSTSIRIAQTLDLDGERSDDPALYGLDPYTFLAQTQAHEPVRAWGTPWVDWDDLDGLALSQPPFTRNHQLLLSRPTILGGYHALRIPWRASHQSGLSLPQQFDREDGSPEAKLSNRTLNMVTTFLVGLHRSASAEEVDQSCLEWLSPAVTACPYLGFTEYDE